MLKNISIAIAACEQINIDYQIMHPSQNLIRLAIEDEHYYFVNYTTPFDNKAVTQIVRDKEYTYRLVKDVIKTPRTTGFVSPFDERYLKYLEFATIESIKAETIKTFPLPVIVKRNRGLGGSNIFLCHNEEEIKTSLETIFDGNSKNYDYVALAQEYIDISREFRAVFFAKKLRLLYEKDISNARFVGNLSPLHWEGAKARHISDESQIAAIQQFVEPVFSQLPVNYGGFDVALDKNGEYWLLEINSSPSYGIFVRDNNPKIIIDMFAEILAEFRASKKC